MSVGVSGVEPHRRLPPARSLRYGLLGAVLLVSLLGCGVGSAAPVSTATLVDPRGDMWRQGRGPVVQAPDQQHGDIYRARVVHGATSVVITARFAALSPATPTTALVADLRTDANLIRTVVLHAGALLGGRQGKATLGRGDGTSADCNVRHAVDWQADTMRLQVPTGCLHSPRWVQASVISSAVSRSPGTPLITDDAHTSSKAAAVTWTARLHHN